MTRSDVLTEHVTGWHLGTADADCPDCQGSAEGGYRDCEECGALTFLPCTCVAVEVSA
jgi:hypothetical protein